MKQLAVALCAALALQLAAEAQADCLTCGGFHPWHNMIAARNKCAGRDQARLNSFWQGYYRNLSNYYGNMENIDWVSYYKHHGTPIGSVPGSCGGPSSVQMAPIDITPPAVPWDRTQNLTAPWAPPRVPWGPNPTY